MLLENWVFSRVPRMSQPPCSAASSAALDDHGGGHVAEDEVAVAVAEVQVARADLRIDHQHRPRRAGGHEVRGRLDAEGGGRAGHVHVEGEAVDAQRLLHLDGHGRIGALHVGGRAQHRVDLDGGLAPGARWPAWPPSTAISASTESSSLERSGMIGPHDVRIDQAGLVDHVARLDARSLLDELGRGGRQRRHLAGRDGLGVGGVEALHIGVEGLHQLLVGEGVRRRVEAGGGDDGVVQGVPSAPACAARIRAAASCSFATGHRLSTPARGCEPLRSPQRPLHALVRCPRQWGRMRHEVQLRVGSPPHCSSADTLSPKTCDVEAAARSERGSGVVFTATAGRAAHSMAGLFDLVEFHA